MKLSYKSRDKVNAGGSGPHLGVALDRQFHSSTQVKCWSTWLLLEAKKEEDKLLCLLLHCCDQTLSWDGRASRCAAQMSQEERLSGSDWGRENLRDGKQNSSLPTGGSQHCSIDFKGTVPASSTWALRFGVLARQGGSSNKMGRQVGAG